MTASPPGWDGVDAGSVEGVPWRAGTVVTDVVVPDAPGGGVLTAFDPASGAYVTRADGFCMPLGGPSSAVELWPAVDDHARLLTRLPGLPGVTESIAVRTIVNWRDDDRECWFVSGFTARTQVVRKLSNAAPAHRWPELRETRTLGDRVAAHVRRLRRLADEH